MAIPPELLPGYTLKTDHIPGLRSFAGIPCAPDYPAAEASAQLLVTNCDRRRGASSPSRLTFDDAFILENSDLFRETIIARNVYAAWARKLTTAKPNDPDLQNIHMEVAKSGEIVSSHLAKLNVPLFKIPASEKELDRIVLHEKNKTIVSPKKQEEKKPAAAPPPPLPLPARVEKERREPSTRTASLPQAAC
ncbi:hypothetical protein TNCV_4674101 [Trichonephila clavipes]|nr:hypothetical protein TNCV_4674101 [Trichonephila clavipes]